jgi:malate dehydrogenase (oxaloacetate-decarboxylating)(NADP+)
MVASMAKRPIIFALANPTPEISPPEAQAVRDDIIMATGRSDYPNQVNNVLCFPFLFRGALDVGATEINEAMKIACVHAISRLARAGTASDIVSAAYVGQSLRFGPEYLIPKPFDPRLIVEIAAAVAQAAMDSGVATRPISDMIEYRDRLNSFVYRSGMIMRPVYERARNSGMRVAFAEGDQLRVLQAVEHIAREKLAFPVLLGRPDDIKRQIKENGLSMREDEDFEIAYDIDEERYAATYHQIMQRRGVSEQEALAEVRANPTLQAALMVKTGDADSMICGVIGRFQHHLRWIVDVAEQPMDAHQYATMTLHLLDSGSYFICDTQVMFEPAAEDIARVALRGAREVEQFGIKPVVALLSHSNFGDHESPSSKKMRRARDLLREMAPDLECDGEMQIDSALSQERRQRRFSGETIQGSANLLVMPNLDAGNITSNALRVLGKGVSIGPILLGCDLPAHIVDSSASVRGIINMTALASAQVIN